MQSHSFPSLQIGLIGHTALLQQNILQFQKIKQTCTDCIPGNLTILPIYHAMQIAQLDGLLITGWHYPSVYRRLLPLYNSILNRVDQLSLWGIASGAAALGQNGLFPVINCTITSHSKPSATTALLALPGYTTERFTGYFIPDIRFSAPAPNLGILCQNQTHGIVAVRQGNHLASSFVAELTTEPYLYQYWLDMVTSLKEWKI